MKIIIEGKAGEGKTLFADFIKKALEDIGFKPELALDHVQKMRRKVPYAQALDSVRTANTEIVIEERQSPRN